MSVFARSRLFRPRLYTRPSSPVSTSIQASIAPYLARSSSATAAPRDKHHLTRRYPTNLGQQRFKSIMTESTSHPLFGLWKPRPLQQLFYGPDTVKNYLMSLLPQENSKAFIVTGTSLATKSPLIKNLESMLGSKHHAGTFSKISQHAPIAQLDEATEIVQKDPNIDTIISVGGGSPIDSSKAISYRVSEKNGGKFLHHIAIPTTLSAAECTAIAGYTLKDGTKTLVANPSCAVEVILYDPEFAKYTPTKLWVGTGMRAMDHAMELMINPTSSEVPCKVMNMYAASKLYELLPKAKAEHPNNPELSTQLFLAAYASLGFWGMNAKGGIGLSHSLGYALGSPYGIPHGETSCLTLGHVVKLKAKMKKEDAEELARMLPHLSGKPTGDVSKDAQTVGDLINQLIDSMEMRQSLTDRGVSKDEIETIVQRATGGQKEGPLYDEVKKLVEGLY